MLLDKTEQKMLILAVINSFEADIDYDTTSQIILICTGIQKMDYFNLMNELCEMGLVIVYEQDSKQYVTLSEKGMEIAEQMTQHMRFTDEPIAKARLEYDRIALGRSYDAELLPSEEDGGCLVKFEYTSGGIKRCSVTVAYSNFADAEKALEKIKGDPRYFKNYIMRYLG